MAVNLWVAPFGPMVDDAGVSYNTSTTLTAISPGAATNTLWTPGGAQGFKAGTIIELSAWGTVSTSGTTPNITLGFYYGGTAGVVLASGTVTLTNQAGVAWPWKMRYEGRVTNTGTSGSINGYGTLEISTSLTALTPRNIPETTAAGIVTIDTTIAKSLVVGGTWSASAATNIAFCHGFKGGAWG
jgi:hypothetical protein